MPINAISLVIDGSDVIGYLRGEHEEMVEGLG